MTPNNLAVLFKSKGRLDQAEPLYQRALATFEDALGPGRPKVTACCENNADLLRQMGRETEARRLAARLPSKS